MIERVDMGRFEIIREQSGEVIDQRRTGLKLTGFFLREVFTFDIDGFAFSCLAGENPVARYIGLVSWR